MRQNFLQKPIVIALTLALSLMYVPRLSADEPAIDGIDMVVGDIQTVGVHKLTRVSVTNPEVADISDAQDDKVSLLAKKAGETVLFLWDASGKRSVKIRVVAEDLTNLKSRIQRLLSEAGVSGVTLEENLDIGKLVMEGNLSKEDKARAEDVVAPYSEDLLNLIKEEKNEELIQVDMQIVEINTSLEKNLGILWGNTNTNSGSGSSSSNNTAQVALDYGENLPTENKFGDLFKIGKFQRSTPLVVTVNALLQEGKARLISKPRLVVVSGKQASFLVGGEIPVLSLTTNATGIQQTQNTTYAQYGVNLSVTPTIREGKIDVLMNVDIRDIDSSNSSNGNVAFTTRTAQTDLFMDNKQTIALAGLIKYTDSEQLTEVPFLSKIPLVGGLFRNRNTPTPDANTEMIIILTPTILTEKKYADKQIVMPTPVERSAWNEIDSKYEHEPLPSWPGQAVVTNVPDSSAVSVGATTTTATPDSVATSTPGPFVSEITSYARMVQEKISSAIAYPQVAAGQSVTGTVKLKLHILKDGSLNSAEVLESSGSVVLDQDAIQAARTAAPYSAFTTGMDQEDVVFTIPIVYNKVISQSK